MKDYRIDNEINDNKYNDIKSFYKSYNNRILISKALAI